MTDLKNLAQEFKIACPNDINRDDYVLLIENQQDMRLIVAHHLNKLGYRKVHQASNGREALDFLETDHEKVAVTLCDITMPIMGGIELLQELRDNPKYR